MIIFKYFMISNEATEICKWEGYHKPMVTQAPNGFQEELFRYNKAAKRSLRVQSLNAIDLKAAYCENFEVIEDDNCDDAMWSGVY